MDNNIKQTIEGMENGEYTLLTTPKLLKEKIRLRHICGYEYDVCNSTNFISKNKGRCPVCSGRFVSLEKLTNYLTHKRKDYKLISECKSVYRNKDTIKLYHSKCAQEYETTIENFFKNNNGCHFCKHPTLDMIKSRAEARKTDGYYVMDYGDSTTTNSKLRIRHNVCQKEFTMAINNFLNAKQNCPFCKSNRRNTNEEFLISIKDRLKEYEILSEYKDVRSKIKVRHKYCNSEYEVLAGNFIKGHGCAKCYKGNKKTDSDFKKGLMRETLENFEFITEYVGSKKKITLRHRKCNKKFSIYAGYFLKFQTCPKCSASIGEQLIESYLLDKGIPFKTQKKFDDCKDKYRLPFDFQVFYQDKYFLLEYDGEQHYYPCFGEKSFKQTKLHDEIKNKYCKENNISLLRIPYFQRDDITQIIDDFLNKFNDYPIGGEIPQQE